MMTDRASWFCYQLQASGDGFVWAMEQLSPDQHFALPPEPDYLGAWEPARHVWHVAEYKRCLVVPTMRQWLGGEQPRDALHGITLRLGEDVAVCVRARDEHATGTPSDHRAPRRLDAGSARGRPQPCAACTLHAREARWPAARHRLDPA